MIVRRATKQRRFRHREQMGDLHQYVIEEEPPPVPPKDKGPKVIKLDNEPYVLSYLACLMATQTTAAQV